MTHIGNAYEAMEQSLEKVAEACGDLTPAVYERFFAVHPEARALFRLADRTRARMLGEVLEILMELAQAHAYMPATIEELAKDHASYGHIPLELYRDLLGALVGVMADGLGKDWSSVYAAAWEEQSERLLALIARTMAPPATEA